MKRQTMFGLFLLIMIIGLLSSRGLGWAQPPGAIVTVVGEGTSGFAGDGSLATAASLANPQGVAVDGDGNLYIADTSNHRIRKVDPDGIIMTVAGNGSPAFSGDSGQATVASLDQPSGVSVDGAGNLYIADTGNHRIRRVDPDGIITTVAGNGSSTFSGDNGPATAASLYSPRGVFVDGTGNLYIADTGNHRIRKVDPGGTITTGAGNGYSYGSLGDGGPATAASLYSPQGVFVDGAGNLYIADTGNYRIRKVTSNGMITTIAGNGNYGSFSGDNIPAITARLYDPSGVFVDSAGNLYIAERGNHRIRRVGPGGIITTVAGSGGGDFFGGGGGFSGDGGPAPAARLNYPQGVFGDAAGVLYIADTANQRIRKVFETPLQLVLSQGFGAVGENVSVSITLVNPTSTPIGGLQFQINPGSSLYFQSLTDAVPSPGFHTDYYSSTVVVYTTSGASIPPGNTLLGRLVYRIDSSLSSIRYPIPLRFGQILVGDSLGVVLPATGLDGAIRVGKRGDVTLDGDVNIIDAIILVRIVLGRNPTPPSDSFAFFVADANGDGTLNVLDVVRQVNRILGRAKVVADGPTKPVTVGLGDVLTLESGQFAIPVTMQADGVLAGAQAAFTFDPARLQIGTPQLAGRADGMAIESHVTGGTLRVIMYSLTGQGIAAGSGTTVLVPVTVLGGLNAAPTLTLSHVVLANHQAQAVPVILGTNTVKVSALPTAFALHPNRPNPFNPTTQIAYEVPQAAHITLAVYNILGQEVIRLVDARHQPGRYVATWNGRNAQGIGVASGVYVYRLTTSTGFSQTRRMTLLK